MNLNDFSPWGILPVLFLLAVAVGLLRMVDRRFYRLLPRLRLSVLWRACWPLKVLLPVGAALVVAALLGAACLVCCLPGSRFWLLAAVVLVGLLMTVPPALRTYVRSLRHTTAHRRYLLASGGSHLESVMPSVRRALRSALLPLLWHGSSPLLPLLALFLLGLMLGGATIAAALASAVLVWAAVVALSVLVVVVLIYLADGRLFDRQDNFIEPVRKT